jgi:hypothetical protein
VGLYHGFLFGPHKVVGLGLHDQHPPGPQGDLTEALEIETLSEPIRETLKKVYQYLAGHREHIDYARYKELGLPVGSGMVESACKWLIQQRFKGVGMRWSEDGFHYLLPLRLAWVNGSFEALFQMGSPN